MIGQIAGLLLVLSGANDAKLDEAVAAPHRTAAFAARDPYRHPKEVLEFFGIRPDMTVAEIWPTSGWWSEILAPYLAKEGTYYAVDFSPNSSNRQEQRYRRLLQARFAADPARYGKIKVTALGPDDLEIAPPASLDLVLTFRNVHNWMSMGYAAEVFAAMFRALKPGGVLGLVQHRSEPGATVRDMETSGYVTEAYVIELAEAAGFVLEARSEINANPKDTKDYGIGVWALPPDLHLKYHDREKYLAIGESDRMTLKFRKPGEE